MQDIPTVYAIVIILGGILPLAVVGCIMAAVALAQRDKAGRGRSVPLIVLLCIAALIGVASCCAGGALAILHAHVSAPMAVENPNPPDAGSMPGNS